MAAASNLAGEARAGTTEPDFANQLHWEREEVAANSVPSFVRPGRAREARSMAGGHGARRSTWPGARRHENTMDSVEENAGRERKLTGVTKTARTAASRGGRRRQFSAQAKRSRGRERRKLGGGRKLGRAGALQLEAEARGGENVGAGASAWQFSREREAGGGFGKKMDLTGGPHPSAARERERGERGKRETAGPRVLGQKAE